jgi:hypothetical protein
MPPEAPGPSPEARAGEDALGTDVSRTLEPGLTASPLQIVEVGSPAEEHRLCRELGRFQQIPASLVAPVVGGSGQAAAIASIARRCGRTAQLRSGMALDFDTALRAGGGPAVPGVVVVGRGIDPQLADLAAALCRAEVVPAEQVPAWRHPGLSASGAAALVLWNRGESRLQEVVATLEALAAHGVPFGLIPCDDPQLGRWILVKTLSFPCIPDRGKLGVVSNVLWGRGRPRCVRGRQHAVASLVRSDLDLLVIDGHGNALDFELGEKTVLCGRLAAPGASGPGLFSCFFDGKCFRDVGHLPDGELVDPRDVSSLLLVMLSCNLLHLGRTPFSSRLGLVSALLGGETVAAIATAGATWLSEGLPVLALGLLSEGRTIGEVAQKLNATHRVGAGSLSGLPLGVSPFVVVGNPCARLAPRRLADVRVLARAAGAVTAAVTAPVDERGAFARIPLEPSDLPRGRWRVRGLEGHQWARAALLDAVPERAAYLWLGPEVPLAGTILRLESSAADGLPQQCATLDTVRSRLGIWPTILDCYLEDQQKGSQTFATLEHTLLAAIRLQRQLSKILNEMESSKFQVSKPSHQPGRTFGRALGLIRGAGQALVTLLAEIATVKGLPDLGHRSSMQLTRSRCQSGPCSCGHSVLSSITYGGPRAGDAQLVRHMCACGEAGQNSPETAIALQPAERAVCPGSMLRLQLRASAPAEHHLLLQTQAAVELPSRDRRIVGPMAELLLEPGQIADLICDLPVPPDLAPGIYPVSLVGVANGGLLHRKCVFEATPTASPGRSRLAVMQAP